MMKLRKRQEQAKTAGDLAAMGKVLGCMCTQVYRHNDKDEEDNDNDNGNDEVTMIARAILEDLRDVNAFSTIL